MGLKEMHLPNTYNYIACFLTLSCNMNCSYCINKYNYTKKFKYKLLSGKKWTEILNRLVLKNNLPITLQGGEPSLHPQFIQIIKNLKSSLKVDILTNLSFDLEKFITEVDVGRFYRKSPYPSIRISYHPNHMDLSILIKKVLKLQKAGFYAGVYGILYPKSKNEILKAKKQCLNLGIDFRIKDFLGKYKGKLFGSYYYPEAIMGEKKKKCLCRTSELIIAPDGKVFRCHHDLYKGFKPIGDLLDPFFEIKDIFRKCDQFGDCNPCDLKVKTDRFQVFGYRSVEIKNLEEVKN